MCIFKNSELSKLDQFSRNLINVKNRTSTENPAAINKGKDNIMSFNQK